MGVQPVYIYKNNDGEVTPTYQPPEVISKMKRLGATLLSTIYIDDETGEVVERRFVSSDDRLRYPGLGQSDCTFSQEVGWWEVMSNGDRRELSDEEVKQLRAEKRDSK